METSNLALAYIVAELQQFLDGAFLNSVQLVKEGIFKIKFHNKAFGTTELLATPNALYKTSYKLNAMENQTGFAAFLKKKLYNKRLLSLEQHGFDRIIEMKFAEFDLVFELFAKGNIILNDKQGKIVSCYKNEEWKDRKTARNEQYCFPASKPGILQANEKDFLQSMLSSEQDCIHAIIGSFNVAPIVAEEACENAKITKTIKANSLDAGTAKKLYSALSFLYSVDLKKVKPVVMEEKGNLQLLPFAFSSIPKEKQVPAKSLNEAMDEEQSKKFLEKEGTEAKKETNKKKSGLLYSRAEQEKARLRLEKDELENKQKAELVYANYLEIKELQAAVKKALEQKIQKKDIMYKLKIAAEKGNKSAKLLVDLDPKTKKIVLDLPSN